MGRDAFTRTAYASASTAFVPKSGPVTRRAEQRARETGKLNPLVDPSSYNSTRRSLLRFDKRPDDLYTLTMGCSMPFETRVDTTASMGHNVDVAVRVLPDAYELCSEMLPGYDLHMLTAIFGDVVDRFVLCRPQFEMEAHKLVEQMTLMVPERGGGDFPEDPQYGIFGGAYLVAAYANSIGLKGYDFTVSDATARHQIDPGVLKRIFGPEVFDNCKANGHVIDSNDVPTLKEACEDLLKRAHAFFLQVDNTSQTTKFWTGVYGEDRVVMVPDTEFLPQVQAVIVGLTEGTLALDQVYDFLRSNNLKKQDARLVENSVVNIPIGAQVPLREAIVASGHRIPVAGDVFKAKPDVFAKTNLWPLEPSEVPALTDATPTGENVETEGPNWL